MKVTVNGQTQSLTVTTLAELLQQLGYHSQQRCVIALNQRIVPWNQAADTAVDDGDQVDILGAITGG